MRDIRGSERGGCVWGSDMGATMTREPYPGSRAFLQEDHDLFFGRAVEAAVLADMWRANRLTYVAGPAASGKTSLVNAGVFPLVRVPGQTVLPLGSLSAGSTFPFAAVPKYNAYTFALLRSWSPGEAPTRLADLSVGEFARRITAARDGTVFAAIDQAEDLLAESSPRWVQRRQFIAELHDSLHREPRLHLLITGRTEAISWIAEAVGDGINYQVKPLTTQGAIEAVTGPLIGTARRFGEGAAEKLVSDLQTSAITAGREKLPVIADFVEPSLLQVSCSHLWENLPAGGTEITTGDVRRYGDVDTALAAHVSCAVVATAEDHDLAPTRLRSWLIDTFVTELGRRRTEYEGLTTTAGLPNAVVWTLVNRHLLSAEVREGAWWHTLLSDRLIEPLLVSPSKPLVPTRPSRYLSSAERALATGELDLAEQYAGLAERATPPSGLRLLGEIASLRGNLALEREKPADAETQYRRAARMFEAVRDKPTVAYQLAAVGQVLLAQGRIPEAVAELRSAVNRMPNDPVLQTELARALWQLGDGQAAVAILTAALEVDGHNLAALRTRGEILADLGDARAALRDLDRISLAGHPAARAARGLALAELNDQPTASHEIETAVSDSPRNGRVLLYAARVSELDGDQAAAVELARRAVDAVDPALSTPHRAAALKLADEIAGRQSQLRLSRLPPPSS